MNIYSGSTDGNGLAAALTNPTVLSKRKGTIVQDYPVEYEGRVWPDAETAYLTLSRGIPDDHSNDQDLLMRAIIAAKLRQHPRLFEAVRVRGGSTFLWRCKHITYAKSTRFQAWEGYGLESRFIRNLVGAYREVADQIAQWETEQKLPRCGEGSVG